MTSQSFRFVKRSELSDMVIPTDGNPLAEVILLDTLGELPVLYALADLVFVGGSLVPWGGHNLLEPALFRKPVLFGPHMNNFREMARYFIQAEAGIMVQNEVELGETLRRALSGRRLAPPAGRQRLPDYPGQSRGRIQNPGSDRRCPVSEMMMSSRLVSAAYEQVVRLRNRGYDAGWLEVQRLERPVISVGNLTLGGTGKTPTVIALGKMLQAAGHSVSVLLRGYKGRHRGGPLPVSDGRRIRSDSGLAGDEALVIARNLPGARVTVGKDRAGAGRWIESREAVDLHLLDDGFQHRQLHRCLDLVLVDVTNPFGGGRMVPSGQLREPLEALRRADAVILTRTRTGEDYDTLTRELRRFKPELPCFLSTQTIEPVARGTSREEKAEALLAGCRALAPSPGSPTRGSSSTP